MSNTETPTTYTVYGPTAIELPDAPRFTGANVEEAAIAYLAGLGPDGEHGLRIELDRRADVAEVRDAVFGTLQCQIARIGF